MACVSLRFMDELTHCQAVFSEPALYSPAPAGWALAGWLWAWRAYTRCSRSGEITSLVGWPGENRKTARGSTCIWAGMWAPGWPCHASPLLWHHGSAWGYCQAKSVGEAELLKETGLANRSACKGGQHSAPISNSAPSRAQGTASERLGVTSVLGPPRFCILDFYHKEYEIKYSAGMLKFCIFVICCQDD